MVQKRPFLLACPNSLLNSVGRSSWLEVTNDASLQKKRLLSQLLNYLINLSIILSTY